jgi:NAD(P)H-nitrite reductase large subunit
MIVCHCFAVRAREIEDAISRGARTPAEIVRACRAGGGCGGCQPVIEELLDRPAAELAPNLHAERHARAHNWAPHPRSPACRAATPS